MYMNSGGGSGEANVLAFLNREDGFESHILFRRAGARSRGEGLYAGGGRGSHRFDRAVTH